MKKFIKGIAIAALAALTVSALAACGADKQASTGDSSAAQRPKQSRLTVLSHSVQMPNSLRLSSFPQRAV